MRILRLAALIVGIMGAAIGLSAQKASATPLAGSLPAATAAAGDNALVSNVYYRRAYYDRRPIYYRRYYRPRRLYYYQQFSFSIFEGGVVGFGSIFRGMKGSVRAGAGAA